MENSNQHPYYARCTGARWQGTYQKCCNARRVFDHQDSCGDAMCSRLTQITNARLLYINIHLFYVPRATETFVVSLSLLKQFHSSQLEPMLESKYIFYNKSINLELHCIDPMKCLCFISWLLYMSRAGKAITTMLASSSAGVAIIRILSKFTCSHSNKDACKLHVLQ